MRYWFLLFLLFIPQSSAGTMGNLKWKIAYNKKSALVTPSKFLLYGPRKFSCFAPHDNKREGTVVSLVGNYGSYFIVDADYCGAHPSVDMRFQTFNLSTKKAISLKEIFGEREILNALLRDNFILSSIGGKSENIKSLQDLYDAFNANTNNCNAIYDSTFYSFMFYDYHQSTGEAAIRINLPYQNYSCNPGLTQLGLTLQAPQNLRPLLLDALKRKNLGRYHRNDTGLEVSF